MPFLVDTSVWHALKEDLTDFSDAPDIGDIKTTLNYGYLVSILRI